MCATAIEILILSAFHSTLRTLGILGAVGGTTGSQSSWNYCNFRRSFIQPKMTPENLSLRHKAHGAEGVCVVCIVPSDFAHQFRGGSRPCNR
jgi:hypothetical protein